MDWDAAEKFIRYFGLPGAMMLALVFAIYKGWLVTGRELTARDEELKRRDLEAERLRAALDRERDRHENAIRTLTLVAAANNQQVTMALQNQERLAGAVEKQVAQASQQTPP